MKIDKFMINQIESPKNKPRLPLGIFCKTRDAIDGLAKHLTPTANNGLIPAFAQGIRKIYLDLGVSEDDFLNDSIYYQRHGIPVEGKIRSI